MSHSKLFAVLLGLAGVGACSTLTSDFDQETSDNLAQLNSTGGARPAERLAHSKEFVPVGGSTGLALKWESAHIDDIEAPFVSAANDFTLVPFSNERVDDLNQFDPATHKFVSRSGDYYFVCVSLASDSGPEFELDLYIDGVRENAIAVSQTGRAQGCRTVRLNAGQSLDVRVFSGGVTSFPKYSSWNSLDIVYTNGQASLDNAATVTMPGQAFTRIPYNTPLYGSAPGGSYTAPKLGWYRICSSMFGVTQSAELDLFVNNQRDRAFGLPRNTLSQGCFVRLLNAGDVIDVRALHYGPASTLNPNPFWNWMTVDSVGTYTAQSGTRLNPVDGEVVIPTTNVTGFVAASGVATVLPGSQPAAGVAGGEYLICASLAPFTGDFKLYLYRNGSLDKGFAQSVGGAASGCRNVRLNTGDTFDVRVLQTGAPITVNENFYWNWVQAYRIL